jgi:hypothetical protein
MGKSNGLNVQKYTSSQRCQQASAAAALELADSAQQSMLAIVWSQQRED